MGPPFSWLCHQEPLPWFDGHIGGSVIPLHVHGHNRSARDETSFPSTSIVLKTVEPKPKPAGLTGLMVDRFKPVNKPNRSAGL
jgi:hypothetical protein